MNGRATITSSLRDGFPHGFLSQLYQNVVLVATITNLPGDGMAGGALWGVVRDDCGPTRSWHGMDLAIVPSGEGRTIVSMLRIVENLGRDPVAARVLFNVIHGTASSTQSPDCLIS